MRGLRRVREERGKEINLTDPQMMSNLRSRHSLEKNKEEKT
jgi:hypothetical protein